MALTDPQLAALALMAGCRQLTKQLANELAALNLPDTMLATATVVTLSIGQLIEAFHNEVEEAITNDRDIK